MTVCLVLAMKRSGHHAIMDWIIGQNPDITHYNNVCFGWEDKKFLTMKGMNESGGDGDVMINIEDFDMSDFRWYDFMSFPLMKKADSVKIILVLRDPYNWIASCYKRKYAQKPAHRDVYESLGNSYINDGKQLKPSRIELWKKQARQFIGEKDYFDGVDFIPVNYNKWVCDKDYRIKLSRLLGIEFSDNSKSMVSGYGGGSSFDGDKIDADKMDVLNRWLLFEHDKDYRSYFDNELVFLSWRIFGGITDGWI